LAEVGLRSMCGSWTKQFGICFGPEMRKFHLYRQDMGKGARHTT
jgi:hypothetical protein